MKIWVDDVRKPPVALDGWYWCKSVNETIEKIQEFEIWFDIELIDLDHDAGDYVGDGGDFIRVLDWLEATGRNYPIRIHTMNPVGRQNMMAICRKNNWKVVY